MKNENDRLKIFPSTILENFIQLPTAAFTKEIYFTEFHCLKSVRIRSYSDQYFPAFGMNTERYAVITPNMDTIYAVFVSCWFKMLTVTFLESLPTKAFTLRNVVNPQKHWQRLPNLLKDI